MENRRIIGKFIRVRRKRVVEIENGVEIKHVRERVVKRNVEQALGIEKKIVLGGEGHKAEPLDDC